MTSTAHQADTPAAPTRVSRRRVLGWGGATALVAATGVLSYRAYDTAVLGPGGGPAHAPWRDWRALPGPRGAVAAVVLAASPHNTQPWEFAVTEDAAEALVADEQQSLDNFAWFRPDNDAEQRHRDGLVLDGHGFGPVQLAVAKLLPPSSRTAGDRFWVNATRDVHTATAAAYGVITTSAPDERRVQLAAGRLVQRIHLRPRRPPDAPPLGRDGDAVTRARFAAGLGTAPLAIVGWFALVPPLVAVVALPIAAVVLRSRPTATVSNTGKGV